MDIGVFIPIGNNGWLISKTSPQYKPSFDLNKVVVQKAEQYDMDFALSMIKLRGFGGDTEFWDYNLESFTLMAGLAAVTSKIKLYATAATLVMPPAIVARMATTIDSISHGRFGVNLITGWQRPEYSQMGMWPGDEFFSNRYEYLSEYIKVCKELWETGQSDFKGEHFQMDDCRMKPMPEKSIPIICAGQSASGMQFSAEHADYNFCFGKGLNTPTAFSSTAERLQAVAEKAGRQVGSVVLMMVISDETDEKAMAKWQMYKEGKDQSALDWMAEQGSVDKKSGKDTNVRDMTDPTSAVNLNMGTLVRSYASVAAMLDEIDTVPGCEGVLLTFDDFIQGMDDFGQKIQPLMKSRQHIASAAVA
ncbi:pyrimidine utilization protein A [Paraglaciecola sp. L3A3]|uniref:pyrimidine utilization protein A n=1 Tax=Paraglaciecola sp. L3A3 TaxID=2686358 RepID=UPI00131D3EE4|nr:pyrimidine utilization protein A [Paraglaciecola sp. L3A3]